MPALGQFLGSSAALSRTVSTWLTETWKTEQRAFASEAMYLPPVRPPRA